MNQKAYVDKEMPTLRAKFLCASDAAESANFNLKAGADFAITAVLHDVVGEWLLRLAKAKAVAANN